MNMNTAFKGFLNKFLGDTDGQEVNAMAEEVAVRLSKAFANGSDTDGGFTLNTALGGRVNVVSSAQTTDRTMTAAESGSLTVLQGDTAGLTITLPETVAGLHYRFLIKSQGNTAADITFSPTLDGTPDRFMHDTIGGGTLLADGDAILSDANDTGAGVGGEYIEFIGDGVAGWAVGAAHGIFKSNTNP